MKNKKITLYLLCIFSFSLFIVPNIKAEIKNGYIVEMDVPFTKEPNIENPMKQDYVAPNILHMLDNGDAVSFTGIKVVSTVNRCKTDFYQVNFSYGSQAGKVYTGYICGDAIQWQIDIAPYEEEFTKAGFPESYFEKLALLKALHPNWKFTAYQTNIDWNEAVKNESVVGISYIQVPDLSKGEMYISLEEGSYDPFTQQYIVKEGNNWYAANAKTVAYYLDPRNFLTEREIFMFENLGYNAEYQTLEAVQNVLKNTALLPYAGAYIEAATYNGNKINPVHLAASSKQEIVLGDGSLSASANGTGKINNIPYYNVYNLGAFSSCKNPIECAINFASGYIQSEAPITSYDRPWTTIEAAIKGGANYIAEAYINKNQNTLYFKKWNVTNNAYGNFSHQYMTNIKAAYSEGRSTYDAYSKIDGLLNSPIEFIIPVYQNMPQNSIQLPTEVDTSQKDQLDDEAKQEEENHKSEIKQIIEASPYIYNEDYVSGIKIGTSAQAMIANIKGNAKDVSVKITRTENNQTIELKDSVVLETNDILTIATADETKTFRIVIIGDVNGDGKVNAVDYVQVKNCIMATSNLTGAYKLAADVNKDGAITAVDYVNIKNYIMNHTSVIE